MTELLVETLYEALSTIEQSAPGAANKNPRTALKGSLAFLEAGRSMSVTQFVETLNAQRPAPSSRPTRARKARAASGVPRAAPTPNMALVEQTLGALQTAEASPDAFAAAISAVNDNKKLRLVELVEVVRRYSGDQSSIRSRPVALGIISQAFDQRWKLNQRLA